MLKYTCAKCDRDFYTADGTRAIRCPYCQEPAHSARVVEQSAKRSRPMTDLIPIKERVTVDMLTLEQYLELLCQYGKPAVRSFGNNEWYCNIDMFVQGKGVEFKIASTFKEPSPCIAAKVCYEKVIDTLRALEKNK